VVYDLPPPLPAFSRRLAELPNKIIPHISRDEPRRPGCDLLTPLVRRRMGVECGSVTPYDVLVSLTSRDRGYLLDAPANGTLVARRPWAVRSPALLGGLAREAGRAPISAQE
jgi:hypothetical protein